MLEIKCGTSVIISLQKKTSTVYSCHKMKSKLYILHGQNTAASSAKKMPQHQQYFLQYPNSVKTKISLILPRSHTGTLWFYTSTSNKRAARPKLYTKSLTRDLKLMYSRLTLVRISIKL